MEYRYKAGDKVRIVEGLSEPRSCWSGRVVVLKKHDSIGWGVPAWSVEGPECSYRFRESEMHPVSEGPVRTETVTTRRIVPGVYGVLAVDSAHISKVFMRLLNTDAGYTATELDELAMVASQLAEALRDVD